MKKLLVLIAVIPLTAVLTAAATVLAIGTMLPERIPAFAPALVERPVSSPVQPATSEPTRRAAPAREPVPLSPVPSAVRPTVELALERDAVDPAPLPASQDNPASQTNPASPTESRSSRPPVESTSPTVPRAATDVAALPTTPTDVRIDYVRLSHEIDEVADVLERFNRKLNHLLARNRAAPADESPAVALDDDEKSSR